IDSLVIQGVLTEELDYTTSPLDYAILERSLGARNTMAWFPVLPANSWAPYDPGPYVKAPLTPVAPDVASSALLGGDPQTPGSAPGGSAEVTGVRLSGGGGPGRSDKNSGDVAQAAGALLGELSQLRS